VRLLLLLLFPLCAQAQMYKCVDERGKIQYTDKPQAGCKETAIRPSPPTSGRIQSPETDFAREDAEFKRRQNERATQEEQARRQLAERCARLRQEYGVLSSGRRLVRINEKGEREYLDDAVRDQRVAQLGQELRGCP
jgi:hypothetical protein